MSTIVTGARRGIGWLGYGAAAQRAIRLLCKRRRLTGRPRLYGVHRVVAEDEQRPPIGAAEQQLDRPFGHRDLRDDLPRRIVDVDLAVRDVHVAGAVYRDAFAAALGEGLEIAE